MKRETEQATLVSLAKQLESEGIECYWSTDAYWRTYMLVGDDTGAAYIQYDYMRGLSLGSVHKPNSVSGTGYALFDNMGTMTTDNVRDAMRTVVPHWHNRDAPPVKYRSVTEYINKDNSQYERVLTNG